MKVKSAAQPAAKATISVGQLPMLAKGKKTGKVVLLQQNDTDGKIRCIVLEQNRSRAEVGRVRTVQERKLNTSFVPFDGTITLSN